LDFKNFKSVIISSSYYDIFHRKYKIFDENVYLKLFKIVKSLMIHGYCEFQNKRYPYM